MATNTQKGRTKTGKASGNPSLADNIAKCLREDDAEVVERKEEVTLIWLSLLARIHVLFIGVPGIAKSMVMRLANRHIDGAEYFERLVFKQTPAEEILGPVSLAALEQDRYERVTAGKLPEAHMAFVDEVFKANATILNSMLSIINERLFHNNGGVQHVPLWSCGFASNELPGLDREDLQAFRDRIAVTKVVSDVRNDDSFKSVIRGQIARRTGGATASAITTLTMEDIAQAHQEVDDIDVPDNVLDELARLRRMCADDNLHVNPRRFGDGVKLMQANAYLAGRAEVVTDDIKVMQHVIWRDPEDEQKAYRIVLDFASEYERAAQRFRDDLDPIRAEYAEIKQQGSIDPNDTDSMTQAGRVKRLYDMLGSKVDEKIQDARRDGLDASALEEIKDTITEDTDWLKKEVFGIGT